MGKMFHLFNRMSKKRLYSKTREKVNDCVSTVVQNLIIMEQHTFTHEHNLYQLVLGRSNGQ